MFNFVVNFFFPIAVFVFKSFRKLQLIFYSSVEVYIKVPTEILTDPDVALRLLVLVQSSLPPINTAGVVFSLEFVVFLAFQFYCLTPSLPPPTPFPPPH